MKKLKIALAILMVLLLSGCSVFSFEGTDIMCPPKATGNKAQIQKLIDKQTTGSYTLKYPKSGSNRSSIIMHDIDFDEEEEAVALYSEKDSENIHALFVEYQNGDYTVVDDVELQSNSIDRVDFADLNGDRKCEVLIGYSTATSSQNTLSIYSYSENIKAYNTAFTYSSLVTGDFNSDKNDDILLISLFSGDISAKATLLTYNNGTMCEVGSTELDIDITALAMVQYGQISDSCYGAIIDGVSQTGDYTTQVVLFDSSAPALINPLYSYQGYSLTRRSTQICSLDFNKDGLVDIPLCSLMSYLDDEDINTVSRKVDWSNFNTSTYELSTTESAILCPQDGYLFKIPEKWKGAVTARYDEKLRETTIYHIAYSGNTFKIKEKIVTIKAYFDENFDKNNSGFTEFLRAGSTVYAYSLSKADDYVSISGDEIASLFTLANQ